MTTTFDFTVTILDKYGDVVQGAPSEHPEGCSMEILWQNMHGESFDYMWQNQGPVRAYGEGGANRVPLPIRNWIFGA